MTSSGSVSVFAGFRFPREVISVAVRWYLRYGLSYRDVEELLARSSPCATGPEGSNMPVSSGLVPAT